MPSNFIGNTSFYKILKNKLLFTYKKITNIKSMQQNNSNLQLR